MARSGKRQSPALRRRKLPNWPLLGLALAGMALSGYLSATAWFGSQPLYCGEGTACDVVQTSHWATLLGLPIAFWGFLTYSALAFIAGRVKKADLHWSYAWLVAVIGLGISLYLSAIAVFVLGAACTYCLSSMFLIAIIVGVLVRQRPEGLPGFRWPTWLAQTGGVAAALVVLLQLHYSGAFHPAAGPEDPYLKGLSLHLAEADAKDALRLIRSPTALRGVLAERPQRPPSASLRASGDRGLPHVDHRRAPLRAPAQPAGASPHLRLRGQSSTPLGALSTPWPCTGSGSPWAARRSP
jgi:hypothetical protein